MHLLPLTLGKLADQTDKRDSTRFALSGVHLIVGRAQGVGANTFTAEVTDSKQLIRVSGPCSGQPDEYPEHPGLATAPNGAFEALIPAETWRRAFVTAVKTTKKAKYKASILQSVAVKVGEHVTTFAATDLDSYPVEQTKNMDGKYPPVNDILRQTRKSKFAFAADPKILAGVLETLATFTEAGSGRVEFYVSQPGKPLYIKAINPDGLNVESVVMPLAPEKGQDEAKSDEAEDASAVAAADEWSKQLSEVKSERDAVAEERDALAREVAHLREELRRAGQAVSVVPSDRVQFMSRRERLALKA